MAPDPYIVILCLVGALMCVCDADGFVFTASLPAAFAPSRSVAGNVHVVPSGRTFPPYYAFDSYSVARSLRDSSIHIQLSSSLRMSADGSNYVEFVKADDLEALQALFAKECDADGLMTKASLEAIPAIAELLVSELALLRFVFFDILCLCSASRRTCIFILNNISSPNFIFPDCHVPHSSSIERRRFAPRRVRRYLEFSSEVPSG